MFSNSTDGGISHARLSDLIGQIYQAGLEQKWDDVLTQLIDITQSNKAFFFLQNLQQPHPLIMQMQTTFDYPNEALRDYRNNPFDDPFYQVSKYVSEGDSIDFNKLIDISTYEHTDYYKRILEPMKSYYTIGGILCRDGVHESAFGMNRWKDESPYSEEDLVFIKLVMPHLSRAVHIFKELKIYKQYSSITKSIVDQSDKAVFVCDQNARVLISNDCGDTLAGHHTLLGMHNKCISIKSPFYAKQFKNLIRECSTQSYSELFTNQSIVLESEGSDSLVINVSPLHRNNQFNDVDIPCCLVTITHQQRLSWNCVSREYALTPKELALVMALFQKKKLNELTSEFDVSYNTLKTHLRSVFKKLDVNSQTELLIKLNMFSR